MFLKIEEDIAQAWTSDLSYADSIDCVLLSQDNPYF